MSSFRSHRIVIASLFLPTIAVLGESSPPTPVHPESVGGTIAAVADRLVGANIAGDALKPKPLRPSILTVTNRPPSGSSLKSLVEDLKDKSTASLSRSPADETCNNPFTKLTRFATTTENPSVNKHHITHSETQTARLRRKQSRSSARRTPCSSVAPNVSLSQSSPGAGTKPWHMEPNPHGNVGLKNALDSVDDRIRKKLWVGTLGTCTDVFGEDLRKEINSRMLAQSSSLPVWIPDAEFESCYDEFCHQVLWPCLHYAVPDAPKTKHFYESASYKQYAAVNQRFADAIIANHQEGDIIWVNDYHLLLLPGLLRASPRISQSTPIGFFMHVNFPSSEIFRCLSVRKDLLNGILGADLVGFQTANNARHFRQTVNRILSYESLPKGIQIPESGFPTNVSEEAKLRYESHGRGRFVDVGVFPMGIDVKQLHIRKNEPEVAEWVQVLQQRYAGMKIAVARDKLDEIQGVKQKLLAFEAFLIKYPVWQGKVVLIQVALQTTESNELGVADVVSRVNSRFSTLTYQPVVFLHVQDLTFNQYLALLTVADAFIVTSLREGMALRTHEYVECQEGRYRPLVLSEFTGSYSYSGFRSCIPINPWNTKGTADAIYQALTMSDEEARSRWEDLHSHVITQTAQTFVTTFLNRCVRAHIDHMQDDFISVPPLEISRVLPRYKHSRKRLILVDFEGTLWSRDLSRDGLAKGDYVFPEEAVNVLGKLAEDSKNEVWLMSGLRIDGVLARIGEKVAKVGIIAENGCFIKTRAVGSYNGEWINMVSNFNLTWKSSCLEILNYFTERTPGSFIEERQASMVWRFWMTSGVCKDSPDRQWALRQAAEAQNHIFDSLGERYGLRIIPGRNSFLILPNNVSRSAAVGAILHPGGPAHSPLARGRSNSLNGGWSLSPVSPLPRDEYAFPFSLGGSNSSGFGSVAEDVDFLLAVSADEKLLRRLNEFDGSETISTSGKGTDGQWTLESEETVKVLKMMADVV